MWGNIVTLYINDTSVRLLVTGGQRVKKWAEIKLEPGLVKDSVVLQESEVASRITILLKSQKIKTRKVILGYSGLHSLTRPATLPQLPKSMLFEAVAREARRVLPLPLDQLYLSWKTIPCPKGRIQVFLAATPRKMADSLIATLHQAGLEPYRMAIKPLSLTRALTARNAILVDLQPSEFDIVIVSAGIPQPIRTIALPEEELQWPKKIEMITADLDRTIKFFDTNNPEKPLGEKTPLWVSGELLNQPELQKTLSEATGRSVVELSSSFKGIEPADAALFMFNLTMAMRPVYQDSEINCPAGSLNVLPAPYRPKPISIAKVMGIPAGVAVTAVLVLMIMMTRSTSANIDSLKNQLEVTNQMIAQKTTQKADLNKSIAALSKQASDTQTAFNDLNKALTEIKTQQEHVNNDLAIVLSLLPGDIVIETISEDPNTLKIIGTTPNVEDIYRYSQTVLNYGRQLDLSQRFKESTVTDISLDLTKPPSTDDTSTAALSLEAGNSTAVLAPADQSLSTQDSKQIKFTLTFKR